MVKKKNISKTGQEEGKSEVDGATKPTPKDSKKTKELASKAVSVSTTQADVKRSKTLSQLEKQVRTGIEKGKEYFLSIGESLAEIQDNKLYKKTNSDFGDYCLEILDISRAAAYRFINGYKTKISVFSPIGDKPRLPELKTESQYRELATVKGVKNKTIIMEIFQEQNPESKVTAKRLNEVVSKHYHTKNQTVSKKEIKQVKAINEMLRTFSSEDISVEGETFKIKSKETEVADFLKRVSEAISAGGSIQIAYKPKKKSKARS
jgi:hypothetical protein